MLSLNVQHSALPLLFNLHGSQTFLLINNLVLHPVFLLNFEVLVALFLIVLTPNDFRLFGFFSLWQEYGFLDLFLFILTLLVECVVILRLQSRVLILHLVVIDFLKCITALDPYNCHLTYLLNPVFVTLLQSKNLTCSLLGVIDLFPCLHLFLLEQSNTIGEELCVPLNAITTSMVRGFNTLHALDCNAYEMNTYSLRRFFVSARERFCCYNSAS